MLKRKLPVCLGLMLILSLAVSCSSKNNGDPASTGDVGQQGTGGVSEHQHTFSTEWSYDEENHWYAADCGHDFKANLATHSDAENDGVCDVCGWDGDHEHTFSESWAYDDTKHWHATTCGHSVIKDEADHVDANNDSICDGCGWNYDHEHTYAEEWSHDRTNHWYAATCGHTVEGKDKDAHSDANNDGICDGCAWNYDHEHIFATEWSHDETNHWHDTVSKEDGCGHAFKSDEGAHTDLDKNGICDGCGWDYDHTHTFDTEKWVQNDTHHWHGADCGHTVDGIDKAEHVDADGDRVCDICMYEYDHVHSFSEDWSYDHTHHFHAALCDHAVRADEAEHVDADNEGHCDVCKYDFGHTHEYTAEWSHDATYHWRNTTCGHNAPADKAEHTDGNNDGKCDGCGWDYDHEHSFDTTKWVANMNHHYHAPTCGHSAEYVRADETAHVDGNFDDKCDDCGGYMSMDVVLDLATKTATAEKVNGGSITITAKTEILTYDSQISYEMGDKYIHIVENLVANGKADKYEYWNTAYGTDSVFAMAVEPSKALYRDMGADSTYMKGYYFSGDFINYAMNCRGVEALIADLYYLIDGDNGALVTDMVEYYDASTAVYSYTFKYGEKLVDVNFKLNDDMVIESAIVTTSYTSTNEEGEEIANQYMISITQTVGARTAVNPYDPEELLIKSYKLLDANGNEYKDGQTINMLTGATNKLELFLSEVSPSTASAEYDKVVAEFDDKLMYAYCTAQGKVTINARTEGTYDLVLRSDRIVTTLTLNVSYPAPTTIYPEIHNADKTYGRADSVTMYLGTTLKFCAGVNESANSKYTTKIITNADNGAISEGTVDLYGNIIPVSVFTPNAVGEYKIRITSAVAPSIRSTLTITVVEQPATADILNGYYSCDFYGITQYTAAFVPESEGATRGTVTIMDATSMSGATTTVFKYQALDDGIELTYVEGDEKNFNLFIDEELSLRIGNFTLEKVEQGGTDDPEKDAATAILGIWSDNQYFLTFNEDGTGMLSDATLVPGSTVVLTFNYTISEDGTVTITNITIAKGEPTFSIATEFDMGESHKLSDGMTEFYLQVTESYGSTAWHFYRYQGAM